MRPQALSLDLFGTIVFFDTTRLPRRIVGVEEKIVTIGDLDTMLTAAAPDVTLEDFLDLLARASVEIAQEKASHGREIPTRERYRRALLRSGAQSAAADAVAAAMAEQHMATLAEAIVCPVDRCDILERLAARHPLALVSNFDHGPTGHSLLARFGLTRYFRTVVISEDVGYLKPSAQIFAAACAGLGCDPAECLHVGDSREADVQGAIGVGMPVLWIGEGDPGPAVGCIADLRELPDWLSARYA